MQVVKTAKNDFAIKRIESMRTFLQEKPKNAKVTSQLACLLYESSNESQSQLRSEALNLAQKAADLAPDKPFGFAALSTLSPEFCDKMTNLDFAIEKSTAQHHMIAKAGLLVRKLIDPRDHEAKGKRGSASTNHPSKRDLSTEEDAIYASICDCLKASWSQEGLHEAQTDFLGRQEYRLGLFFRKKHPPEKHRKKSIAHFRQTCAKLPATHSKVSLANFWLGTLSSKDDNNGTSTLQRCPKDYIISLYSTFAPRFDNLLLESLKYTTPTEIRRLVDQVVGHAQLLSDSTTRADPTKEWADKGVDLGCGTGLSGEAFRDCVGHLTGVDLSPDMLEKARMRKCYDETVVGDCISVLTGHGDLDLIIACDVFVYIGDLKDTFAAAYSSLSQNGLFAFSTELLAGASSETEYVLHSCARFSHAISYIEKLALDSGFKICGHKVCVIRKNQGKDVRGSLFVLMRPRFFG